MEASGPYYVRLANFLAVNAIPVSVVNPLVIRRFCQMRMSRAKTDKKDSKMIAEYGCMENPPLWQPPKEYEIALQQMQTLLANVQKEYQAVNNQFESFIQTGMINEDLEELIKKELAHKQELIDKLTRNIEEEAKKHYSSLLTSLEIIPGLGKKTAIA